MSIPTTSSFFRTATVVAFLIFSVLSKNCIAQNDDVIQNTLEEVANSMNAEGPTLLGSMRLDFVSALPGKKFNWNYSYLVDQSQIDWELVEEDKIRLRNMALTSPDMAGFREWGVTMKWSYFDMSGEFLFEVTIRPEDYGFESQSGIGEPRNGSASSSAPGTRLGQLYRVGNHPKAKGLEFEFNPPLEMEGMEANRPNIVRKWQFQGDDVNDYVELQVIVKVLPEELHEITKDEMEYFLKYEDGMAIFMTGVQDIRKQDYFVLDQMPGMKTKYQMTSQRLDVEFTFHMITATAFYGKYLFNLNLLTTSEGRADELEPLFNRVCNTVVFPQQY